MIVRGSKPVEVCGSCPLRVTGEGFVLPDGPRTGGILLVGEAPGEAEARLGKPFVGQAGFLLDRILERAGLDRASFRVANTLCCRPPRNYLAGAPYEDKAIACCAPLLSQEIDEMRPRVIVALGNTALKRLTGKSGIGRYRGYPIPGPYNSWIVPTYHPSFLLPRQGQRETGKLTGVVILDFKKAVSIAAQGFRRVEPRTLLDPTPEEALLFAIEYENAVHRDPETFLSWDIETPGKLTIGDEEDLVEDETPLGGTILRIGFAFSPNYAMSIPWNAAYLPVIRRLLSHPTGRQVVWNGYAFDLPIVGLQGIRPVAPVYDGMWAWHLLQSNLPRGLESVTSHYGYDLGAWKHLADSAPARYNALDAIAALRCMIGIERDLKERGQWDLCERHVCALSPFLYEAGRVRGVDIDRFAQEALRDQLTARQEALLREAQQVVDRRFHTTKVYRHPPKEKTTEVVPLPTSEKYCATCGKSPVNKVHLRKCPGPILDREVIAQGYRWIPDFAALEGTALLDAVSVAGFNPISQKQLIAYARAHNHPIGENYKTGNEQFDKKVREKLIKKVGAAHPIYALSQELAEITKTLGTYVDGFRPDYKGRIYTTYTFSPASGRLASRNVNIQNVATGRNPWSAAIRRTIVPPPGYVFVEADSSNIEAVMTGFFMQDPVYLAAAKADIHSYITCLELGLPFDVAQIATYKKDPVFREARERNKRVNHGTNYGMTPRMMMMSYPDIFPNEKVATEAQAKVFAVCPRLPEWQHEVRLAAHRQTYLQNPWGYRCYFYNVFVRDRYGKTVKGSDANSAVSFLPQSSAAAFMRDSLLALAASPWGEYARANVSIHDSICLAVPASAAEEAVTFLSDLLTRTIPEMADLQIGCDVKVGPNWGQMTPVLSRRV